ncbi:hypothetical protein VTN31DRAFT_3442 [Thermomyces dupontii]|uniref:uncharacterized protein n=1 Tax=Talaromyces thermophilus TaxID=28565 RepID=UPI0037441F7B
MGSYRPASFDKILWQPGRLWLEWQAKNVEKERCIDDVVNRNAVSSLVRRLPFANSRFHAEWRRASRRDILVCVALGSAPVARGRTENLTHVDRRRMRVG